MNAKMASRVHFVGMGALGLLGTALLTVAGYAAKTLLSNQQQVIETQSMLVQRSKTQADLLKRLVNDHDKLTALTGVVSTHGYEIKLNSKRINRMENRK